MTVFTLSKLQFKTDSWISKRSEASDALLLKDNEKQMSVCESVGLTVKETKYLNRF